MSVAVFSRLLRKGLIIAVTSVALAACSSSTSLAPAPPSLGGLSTFGKSLGAALTLGPVDGGVTERAIFEFNGGSGDSPETGPVADGTGALYGTTREGGAAGLGNAYELVRSGSAYTLVRVYDFQGGYNDGADPWAPLLLGKSHVLFGTTQQGGDIRYCRPPQGCGVVFQLTPSKRGYDSSVLYRFQGGTDGETPSSGLIADASGSLYGSTASGGTSPECAYGCGTVYRLDASRGYAETVLYSFQGQGDGEYPGSLTLDSSGAIYGTAQGASLEPVSCLS
jgi:uncharacterized repeat protein (TIGR03803 family)